MFQRYTTIESENCRRLEYWNEVVAGLFSGMVVDGERSIAADWAQCSFGDIGLALARSQKSVVSRWAENRSVVHSGRILIHLQHAGTSRTQQRRKAAVLCGGDMTICLPDEPYRIDISNRNEMFVLNCPEAVLDGLAKSPENAAATLLNRSIPSVGLLHDFVGSLFRQDWHSEPDDNEGRALSDILMRLVRYAVVGGGSDETRLPISNHERTLAFVEEHLFDAGLRTGMIAQRLSVSVRTIQGVFAEMATTPTAYITDRRLAIATDILRSGRDFGTVTDLAYDLGFCDAAHFARRFRERFGLSPGALARNSLKAN